MADNEEDDKGKKRRHWRSNGFEEGYMNVKMRKLEEQNLLVKANIDLNRTVGEKNDDLSNLFRGVSIHVNGYTDPPCDELKKLILAHGGNYDHYYSTSKTTHIIATNLAFTKIRKLKNEKVVKPEWIVDSIRERQLLPDVNYALYKSNQRTINFVNETSKPPLTPTKVNGDESRHQIITPTKKHSHMKSPVSTNNSPIQQMSEASTSTSNVGSGSTTAEQVSSNQSKALTAVDPNFVQEYFKRSRLHHISTSSNDLKNYVEHLIDNHDGNFSGLEKLLKRDSNDSGTRFSKCIMIVDMDCFFVSVALRTRPHLKDKPVAVTHSRTGRGPQRGRPDNDTEIKVYEKYYQYYNQKQDNKATENGDFDDMEEFNDLTNVNEDTANGANETRVVERTFDASGSFAEIASCNYAARQFGIKNGMHVGEAVKLCPNLVTLPYEFEEYSKVSKMLYDTIASYTVKIEAVSCDECFVDITDILNTYDVHSLDLASKLRREIFLKTNCTCSVGIASNILLAKLALKLAKPNGQHFLPDNKALVNAFICNVKVRDLPGIGYSTSARLKEVFKVATCGELQNISLVNLQKEFGEKSGKNLYEHCRGIDRSVLKTYQTQNRKSVSAVVNYGIRFTESSQVHRFMLDLAKEVANRMDAIKAKGKLIGLRILTRSKDAPVQTLKFLGCGLCDSTCKSTTLRSATNSATVIGNEAITLLRSIKHNVTDLRGIGIQIGKLEFPQSFSNAGNHLQSTSANKNLLSYFSNSASVPKSVNDCGSVLPETSRSPPTSVNAAISTKVSASNSVQNEALELQSTESIASLPSSFSMIDKETLNALPEYMRREILSNYNISSASSETKKTNGKVQSKKGKGKKVSKTNTKANTTVKEGPLDRIFNDIKSGKKQINILDVNLSNVPHICGKTDIDSMLSLIREWVITEEELLDDDCAYITNFLMKLVDTRNFTLLNSVMQTLHEVVLDRNSNEWKVLFNNILKSMINEMSDCDRLNVSLSSINPFEIV